tara:strand:- start:479 stop:646 length:168 start_codon:yes stop_codon:yes gene_type:complete
LPEEVAVVVALVEYLLEAVEVLAATLKYTLQRLRHLMPMWWAQVVLVGLVLQMVL